MTTHHRQLTTTSGPEEAADARVFDQVIGRSRERATTDNDDDDSRVEQRVFKQEPRGGGAAPFPFACVHVQGAGSRGGLEGSDSRGGEG